MHGHACMMLTYTVTVTVTVTQWVTLRVVLLLQIL